MANNDFQNGFVTGYTARAKGAGNLEQVQADYIQNDETAIDYIKNRQFYKVEKEIPGGTHTLTRTNDEGPSLQEIEIGLEENMVYDVLFTAENGAEITKSITAKKLRDVDPEILNELVGGDISIFNDNMSLCYIDSDTDLYLCLINNAGISDEGEPCYKDNGVLFFMHYTIASIQLKTEDYISTRYQKLNKEYLDIDHKEDIENKISEIDININNEEYGSEIQYPNVKAMRKYVDDAVSYNPKVYSEPAITLQYGPNSSGKYYFDIIKYAEGDRTINNSEQYPGNSEPFIGVDYNTSVLEFIYDETEITAIQSYNKTASYQTALNGCADVTCYAKTKLGGKTLYFFVVPGPIDGPFYDSSNVGDSIIYTTKDNLYVSENYINIANLTEYLPNGETGGFKHIIPETSTTNSKGVTTVTVKEYELTRDGIVHYSQDNSYIYIGNMSLKDASFDNTNEDFLFYWDSSSGNVSLYFLDSATLDNTADTLSSSNIAVKNSMTLLFKGILEPEYTSKIVYYSLEDNTFTEIPDLVLPRLVEGAKIVSNGEYLYLFGGKRLNPDKTTLINSFVYQMKYDIKENTIHDYKTLSVRLPRSSSVHQSSGGANNNDVLVVNGKVYCGPSWATSYLDISNPERIDFIPSKNVTSRGRAVSIGDNAINIQNDGMWISNINDNTSKFISIKNQENFLEEWKRISPRVYENTIFVVASTSNSDKYYLSRIVLSEALFKDLKGDNNKNVVENKFFGEETKTTYKRLISVVSYYISSNENGDDFPDVSILPMNIGGHSINGSHPSGAEDLYLMFHTGIIKNPHYNEFDNSFKLVASFDYKNNAVSELITIEREFQIKGETEFTIGGYLSGTATYKYAGNLYIPTRDISLDTGEDYCYLLNTTDEKNSLLLIDIGKYASIYGAPYPYSQQQSEYNRMYLQHFALYATNVETSIKKIDTKYIKTTTELTEASTNDEIPTASAVFSKIAELEAMFSELQANNPSV